MCNGVCALCGCPCRRGEVKPITKKEEAGASKVFGNPQETGLSVVENADSFEVVKTAFGKEKIRRVK